MRGLLSLIAFVFFCGEAQAYLTASPASVNFFTTEVGSIGRTQTIWIRNNSDEDVNVSTNHSCYGGFHVSGFCGYLGRWGSCTLTVQFRPRREGYQSCSINVRQTSGGFDQVHIHVSGRGVERGR